MTAVPAGTTVGAALAGTAARLAAAGCVSAKAEARWLLEEALGTGPGALAGRRTEPLPPEAAARLEEMVARRAAGEPLQYVIGWAPFGRLRLEVGPGVFVPRPETELVAERAARHLMAARRAGKAVPVAVDLCTGSGAIACFLAEEVPGARVLATEIDPAALAWARRNVRGRPIELLAGDLDEPLPADLRGRVDVLVANVPYVPAGAMPLLPHDVREHEPRLALDGGPDGLDVLRRVAALAPRWLAPGGWLVCEVGEGQREAVALLAAAGLAEVSVRPDLAGRDRVLEGVRGTQERGHPSPGGDRDAER
jgi:release factor glutamine methyltransferase